MNTAWGTFLRRQHEVQGTTPIRVCVWVESLLHFGVLPELKRSGYTVSIPQQQLATCILNYLFRHEKDYAQCKFTKYCCTHALHHEYHLEEHEFYMERIPESTWQLLRTTFSAEWLADEGWFADRFWRHLPDILFSHIDMETSPANEELWAKITPMDEEEGESE